MPGGRWYSVHGCMAYERCPRAFKLRHVERVKTEEKAPEHFRYGRAVHAGLAEGFRALRQLRTELADHAVRDRALAATRESWTEEGLTDADGWLDRALESVDAALAKYPPVRPEDVLWVEDRLLHQTTDGTTVNGHPDLILRSGPTALEVVDHKTGRPLRPDDLLHDLQGNVYGWLAMEEFPWAATVHFTHHYPSRPGRPVSVQLTREGMDEAVSRMECHAEMVEMDQEYSPRLNDDCSICAYRETCPAWTSDLMQELVRF